MVTRRRAPVAAYEEAGSPRWLKWGLAVLLGLPLLCGGSGLLAFLYIRSESPYDDAVARATSHGRVNKVLGAPVSANFFFSGKMQSNRNDGIAVMEIGLSGSTQDGTLQVKGVRTSGVWGFSLLRVIARDGTEINVVGGGF